MYTTLQLESGERIIQIEANKYYLYALTSCGRVFQWRGKLNEQQIWERIA